MTICLAIGETSKPECPFMASRSKRTCRGKVTISESAPGTSGVGGGGCRLVCFRCGRCLFFAPDAWLEDDHVV